MADNVTYKDANAISRTIRTTEQSTVHTPHGIACALEAGVPVPVSTADPMPVGEAESDIALGLRTGRRFVNKAGRNPLIDTSTTPQDIWTGSGLYTGFPTTGSAETLSIESSDVNDTAAGTGARTVQLIGLDSSYNEISEVVSLNGTTPVLSTLLFWRMHTANVQSAGSGGVNAGIITIRHSTTTANVFSKIPAGRNQSSEAVFTVPAGHTALLRRLSVFIRSANTARYADGEVWVRQFGAAPRFRRPWTVNANAPYYSNIYGGLVLPEKTDISIRCAAVSSNNTDLLAEFDLELIAD